MRRLLAKHAGRRACAVGAIFVVVAGALSGIAAAQTPAASDVASSQGSGEAAAGDGGIEIGVAYGTEKRKWLTWAVEQFEATEEGRRIHVNLIPMGSLEGAHAILAEDKRIHVWSPASGLYKQVFCRDWEARFRGNPILKAEPLALTPMVIVMWKDRYDAYTERCPEVSLRTINYAMQAKTGWDRIAGKPAWGHFKFSHTHPNQSNSGLMTLMVLAYEFYGKKSGLSLADIAAEKFQEHLRQFERGVTGMSHSTGTLMKQMIARGPTSCDAVMVYESVAIDYLREAESRWGPFRVVYPRYNLWSENPYCILNTPWVTKAHQEAAERFLRFLLSEPIQSRALDHGFRPANPAVAVLGEDSPFKRFAASGLSVEVPEVCDVPSADVIENLLQSWLRNAVPR